MFGLQSLIGHNCILSGQTGWRGNVRVKELDSRATHDHLKKTGLNKPHTPGFAHYEELRNVRYDWHKHPYHQLLYAIQGTACVEVGRARYFLPPQRAAWISAGTVHRTTIPNVISGSVFFSPKWITWHVEPIRIIAAPPLLREMVKYAVRWPAKSRKKDPARNPYFRTFALLCKDWLQDEMPFWLPHSDHPQIARALEYTLQHLQCVTVTEISKSAAMSVRSFRRHFMEEMGMTWRDYLVKVRLLRAMELLANPGVRIIDVAAQVGFDSSSAFSKAFTEFALEAPSQYQRRIQHGSEAAGDDTGSR